MRLKRRLSGALALGAAALLAAGCGSAAPGGSGTAKHGQVTVGVDLTYNNTAFWASYISYERQYAQSMHVKLLGPLLAQANAALQNQQIENLVNEGAQAIIVNPETATSLGPAISYAAARHVRLISVDTIVGAGHVYLVVRASNTLYGQDACAYISGKVKSGYVLDLEGDLTSSNGADRTKAFEQCMAANDPGAKVLKDPTTWSDATAVTDAQNAVNAYGRKLKAIYVQWSAPDTALVPLLKSKGLDGNTLLVSDDGVPFEMCDIGDGSLSASQSQPANLYARYALTYAVDAARGVTLKPGQPGGGGAALANVSYSGDANLADPIVAPFVTKTAQRLSVDTPVDGLPATSTSTAVTDQSLWGNEYGASHGGVCSAK